MVMAAAAGAGGDCGGTAASKATGRTGRGDSLFVIRITLLPGSPGRGGVPGNTLWAGPEAIGGALGGSKRAIKQSFRSGPPTSSHGNQRLYEGPNSDGL